jgi:cell division protein FtsI (penicillin-binding protein 3)
MSFADRRRPVDTIDRRVGLLFGIFLVLMLIAAGRAAYLGVFRGPTLKKLAAVQQVQDVKIPAERGEITDRNGVVLALTESADKVVADPYIIDDPQKVASEIAPLLGLTVSKTLAGLTKSGTGYSVLGSLVPAADANKIMAMRINGINDTAVSQRVYPRGSSAMQVLGWTGANGKGAGGLEYLYNKQLSGKAGQRDLVNDAKGQAIAVHNVKTMVPGKNLKLTISAPLQTEVEQALAQVGQEYDPKNATAIAMNPDTGQILALANWPSDNGNDINASPIADTEDYGVGLSYEPGSTFKAITVAGALSDGAVTPSTEIYVPSVLQIANRTIHDAEDHPDEDMTVANVLKVSSNIGADEIAAKEGATKFNYWMHRFGFGKPTGVDLPGEQRGIVPPMSQWSAVSMGNFPFGQGIEVTPMQMVRAYSAIANGGILRTPSIVESVGGKKVAASKGHRVITPGVASEMRDMLRGVLADGGTASGAQIYGYDLAGKTGTANIVVGNHYSDTEYMASFIGMVPASNPKLVVAVLVDEPQGSIYGGSVAAPAFKQIVGWAVPYFGINPCPSPCPASAYENATPSTP